MKFKDMDCAEARGMKHASEWIGKRASVMVKKRLHKDESEPLVLPSVHDTVEAVIEYIDQFCIRKSPETSHKPLSYVVGFAFSEDLQRVALIRKVKPSWQAGRLNGIGGKIEPDEDGLSAMIREFEEEAGVRIDDWKMFAQLGDADLDWLVYFFWARTDLAKLKTMTVENVVVVPVDALGFEVLPNLHWIIPMALNDARGEDDCTLFTIRENAYRSKNPFFRRNNDF